MSYSEHMISVLRILAFKGLIQNALYFLTRMHNSCMVRVQKLTLFLPRDAMRYIAVFAVVRCPSVRLSITFVHCIQTAEDIVKHLYRPGSVTILVF